MLATKAYVLLIGNLGEARRAGTTRVRPYKISIVTVQWLKHNSEIRLPLQIHMREGENREAVVHTER